MDSFILNDHVVPEICRLIKSIVTDSVELVNKFIISFQIFFGTIDLIM